MFVEIIRALTANTNCITAFFEPFR
uniref:Uncharacterized protein n=1 Tax=Rhizophora mucronata TaxID=61149 RepID=A0A2P2P4Z1_RHIMU